MNRDDTGSAVCPLDAPQPGARAVETFHSCSNARRCRFRFVGTTAAIVVLGGGQLQ